MTSNIYIGLRAEAGGGVEVDILRSAGTLILGVYDVYNVHYCVLLI